MSGVTIPLKSKEGTFGSFALFSRRTNAYGPKDLTVLERLATLIFPAFENARLYRESEYLDLALESIGDAVMIVGTDAKVRFINRASGDMFGYSEEEFIGGNIFAIVPPDDASQAAASKIELAAFRHTMLRIVYRLYVYARGEYVSLWRALNIE